MQINNTAIILVFCATLGVFASASETSGPSGNATDAAKAGAGGDGDWVEVSRLTSVEANQRFRQNVQVMQRLRNNAMRLRQALSSAGNDEKRGELRASLDELMAKINENNQKMVDTYGFSLAHDYRLEVERAHVYMRVTPEEAERIRKQIGEAKRSNQAKGSGDGEE